MQALPALQDLWPERKRQQGSAPALDGVLPAEWAEAPVLAAPQREPLESASAFLVAGAEALWAYLRALAGT